MIYVSDYEIQNSPLVAWNNLVTNAALTASTEASGFPVSGLLNGVTTDPWKPTAMPATVTINLDASVPASVLAFAAHDMHTNGVTVLLQRWDGAAWVDVMERTPESDDPFMMAFPVADSDQWRVTFTGGVFSLSVLHLSKGMTIPGRVVPPHTPLHIASEVELLGKSESATGEFLQADFMRTGANANLAFSVQEPAFIKGDEFEAFRQHFNRARPFFFATSPRHERKDMGYCWRMGGNMIGAYQDARFMAVSAEVGLYVR